MGGSIGLLLLLVAFYSLWNRDGQSRDPALKLYFKLCDKLAKRGYPRQDGEGPVDYARRLSGQLPAQSQVIQNATRAFVTINYQATGKVQSKALLKLLKREVRSL